ncbi:MAG: hypothetical protein ACE5IR_23005 [bacterium]
MKSRLHVTIEEKYQTTLQQRVASDDLWKDKQEFKLILGYPLNNRFSVASEFFSYILSDPFAGFDNDVMFHSGSTRLQYRPSPQISVSSHVSSKWQTQIEQNDSGFGLGFGLNMNQIRFDGYHSDLAFSGERDFFPKRKNDDFRLRYQIGREFHAATGDTLIILFNRLRRDSFDVDKDGVYIRNLSQTQRGFENRLNYQISSSSSLSIRNIITSTSFKVNNLRDTDKEIAKDDAGFESDHTFALRVQQPKWYGKISWNTRSRSRDDRRPEDDFVDPLRSRHPSLGFDTDEIFVNLGVAVGFKFSGLDSIGFNSSVSKFQFDTSDTTNPNDHDQIRWQISFAHAHDFGSGLSLVWRANAFLNHFVFISGKFSGDNSWERVLQLAPVIVYKPNERFVFRQGFTVRAKYRTFDFNDSVARNRNSVNRQFSLFHKSRAYFTPKTWLDAGFHMELGEQGKLFYNLWRQGLALSWRTHEASLRFGYKAGSQFLISTGGSLFHQVRWNHRFESDSGFKKTVRDKHTNFGPVLQVSYQPGNHVQFVFLGSVKVVHSSGRETDYINNFDVNLNWFF